MTYVSVLYYEIRISEHCIFLYKLSIIHTKFTNKYRNETFRHPIVPDFSRMFTIKWRRTVEIHTVSEKNQMNTIYLNVMKKSWYEEIQFLHFFHDFSIFGITKLRNKVERIDSLVRNKKFCLHFCILFWCHLPLCIFLELFLQFHNMYDSFDFWNSIRQSWDTQNHWTRQKRPKFPHFKDYLKLSSRKIVKEINRIEFVDKKFS